MLVLQHINFFDVIMAGIEIPGRVFALIITLCSLNFNPVIHLNAACFVLCFFFYLIVATPMFIDESKTS